MEDIRSIADEQREHPCDEVDSCHDHRCGMDEGGHRCRAFHSIREPDMQGEHGALAGSSDEHQPEGEREHSLCRTESRSIRAERECPGIEPVNQNSHKEAEVSEPCDDKCFLGSGNSLRLRIVEPDKQV